ncbi:hypothetical protein [Kitasatospora sp. NPDC085879]|uniref:hypothetical protein n=1 Tax=Kitasatospora sp. NPDC085879 TaxID=3154769 RepID=UPI003447A9EF
MTYLRPVERADGSAAVFFAAVVFLAAVFFAGAAAFVPGGLAAAVLDELERAGVRLAVGVLFAGAFRAAAFLAGAAVSLAGFRAAGDFAGDFAAVREARGRSAEAGAVRRRRGRRRLLLVLRFSLFLLCFLFALFLLRLLGLLLGRFPALGERLLLFLVLVVLGLRLADVQRALAQRVREFADAPVGCGRHRVLAGFEQFTTDLLVQFGDLWHLCQLSQPLRDKLARFEPEPPTCEIGGGGERQTPLLDTPHHVTAGDGGSKGDLGGVLHGLSFRDLLLLGQSARS